MIVIEKRLDRFEDELGQIRQAIVQMARTEERVAVILDQTTQLFKQNSELAKRVANIEKENATQGQSIGFFERLSWIVVTAVLGAIGWLNK